MTNEVVSGIEVPFFEVDAHNVVPCWEISQKEGYAAHTFRPKLYRLLPEFLDEYSELEAGLEFPEISSSSGKLESFPKIQGSEIETLLPEDLSEENADSFSEPEYFEPGERVASVASIFKDLTILNNCNRFYTTFCC